MRVTANSFPNTLLGQLQDLTHRQSRLQQQAATGQKVVFPEDDPAAMRRVMDMQTEAVSLGQYRDNIGVLKEYSTAAYDSVEGLKKVAVRATEIAVRADGLKSDDEMDILSKEVTELIHQAAALANAKHRNNFLFGGTKSDQKPYDVAVDANGRVTGVTYNGNDSVAEVEISPGATLSAQNPGENNTGSGARGLTKDSRTGADLFAHLISLQDHLVARDTAAINAGDLPDLVTDEDNLIFHMATNGSIRERLDSTSAIAFNRTNSLERQISDEADADLAQTLVRLTETQNAYQAALQSAGRIMNQSLLDYVR